MNTQPINAGIRIATMLLDHVFMTFIAMIFYLPMFFSMIFNVVRAGINQEDISFPTGPMTYLGVFGITLYFCKDLINGRSLAKRILKLQLVDNKTGEVASPLQCFVRNIFCIIWPVEVIVALSNTSRRIGDKVAGTRLAHYDPALHKAKPNFGKIALPVLICMALTIALTQLIPTPRFTNATYKMSSYNQADSEELEQLIRDSLGEYVSPEIKIYDTVKNSHLKHVSAVLTLKKNYIEDYGSYRQLLTTTNRLIYSRLPQETFTGQLRFVFRGPGQYLSKSSHLGARHTSPAK